MHRRRIDDKSGGDDGPTGDREGHTCCSLFMPPAASRPIRSPPFDMAAAADAARQAHDETDYPLVRVRSK